MSLWLSATIILASFLTLPARAVAPPPYTTPARPQQTPTPVTTKTPAAEPTQPPAQAAPATYTINPDKLQTGKSRDVTITTDTGDLSKAEIETPAAGSGITFETLASGQTVEHVGDKIIKLKITVDEDADIGTVPITIIKKEGATTTVLGIVNLIIAEFKPRKISRGPTPDDIDFDVDAMWNVLPYKVVKENFGRRAADSFYAIEVFLGNNSGFDIQVVGVGFDITAGMRTVDKYGKPLAFLTDDKGKPVLDEYGNKYIEAVDANGERITANDGKPVYRLMKKHMLPTSDHRLVRGSIEVDQLYGSRALTLNLIGGFGTLVSGFIPFFHRANAKANYSSLSSILNGQLKEGFGIAAPDLTVSQLNRLENMVLHDGLTVLNNSQSKTIVFFPRHVVELDDTERKAIDSGKTMQPLLDKLGELIIVGKPVITFRNREIVATRPQPAPPPPANTPATPPAAPPTVARVEQNEGNAAHKTVVISGTNFVNGSTVTFGGAPSPKVTFLTPNQLNAEIPEDAVTGKVAVTTPSGARAESPDEFVAQPRITGVEPKNAAPGSPVTISGANLANATAVKFGSASVPAANFTLREKDKIIVTVPNNAESGLVVVETPAGNTPAPDKERFVAQPILDPLQTKQGKAGDRITITGKNLDGADVRFGSVPAEVLNPGATSIEVKVPPHAESGPITVKTPGGEKKSEDFTVIPSPLITGFSVNGGPIAEAASGKVGDALTVTGLNLKNPTAVKFGTATITPTSKNDVQITFTIPEGVPAGTVNITITTPGGDVSSDKFTLNAKPAIIGFFVNGKTEENASGKAGDTIVLVGQNLKGATEVKFGETPASVVNTTDAGDRLTVKVPGGLSAGAVTIKVTTPGGSASTDKFTVTQ